MNFKAFSNTVSHRCRTLPIVILYVTEGCNLRCLMCSYRKPLPNELSLEEIEKLSVELFKFGLQHVVYSGGEPLLRKDFPEICKIFSRYNIKQTLLTNGLLLSKRYHEIQTYFDEIIVSLDGATDEVHNTIRGADSFGTIINGIKEVRQLQHRQKFSIRTVLQKSNFRQLPILVELAQSLGVDRISFLAVDVRSDAYGRLENNQVVSDSSVILTHEECSEFENIVEHTVNEYQREFQSGFISESPEKLQHILQYFKALIGQAPFPKNNCNAPNVSAVITSTGDIQPCYFLPSFGNIRQSNITSLTNSTTICKTRKDVSEYTLQQCKMCVCTLRVPSHTALLNKF